MTTMKWIERLYNENVSFKYTAIGDTVKVNGFEFTGTEVPDRNMGMVNGKVAVFDDATLYSLICDVIG